MLALAVIGSERLSFIYEEKSLVNRLVLSVGILAIVYFLVMAYNHVGVARSKYGRNFNESRVNRGIPIIDDALAPEERPKNEFDGIRWEGPKAATIKEKIVHTWKLVEATKEDGWLEEWDAFRYYIDDTTNVQLNLYFKTSSDSTVVSGKLGKLDTRKESFDDYLNNEYPRYGWTELDKQEIDSIRYVWKI